MASYYVTGLCVMMTIQGCVGQLSRRTAAQLGEAMLKRDEPTLANDPRAVGLLEQSQWAEDNTRQGIISALPQLAVGDNPEDPLALSVPSKQKMYDPVDPDERTFSAMA